MSVLRQQARSLPVGILVTVVLCFLCASIESSSRSSCVTDAFVMPSASTKSSTERLKISSSSSKNTNVIPQIQQQSQGGKRQQQQVFTTTTSLGPVARNGLQYEDVEIGTGRRVLPGDAVLCYYVGTYQQQKGLSKKSVTFDETEPGEPAEFVVGKGQVIPGWDIGILGNPSLDIPPMKIGGDRKLVVPAGLAYGDREVGPIPANQDLEFQIMIVNAQPTGGVSAETQIKGIAGLVGVLSFFAVLGLFISQNYNSWF